MLIFCRETSQDIVFIFPVFLFIYSISVAEKVLWCGFTNILCCIEKNSKPFGALHCLPRT
jgi:hypothetical protein